MSILKGTTMHPRCRHIGACSDLLECWFKLFSTSQNTSQFQFRTFLKKNQISWFSGCSTREDLSVDVSITNVGLILTKPGRFRFSAYGNSGYGQNSISSISNFLKNFHIFGFPWCFRNFVLICPRFRCSPRTTSSGGSLLRKFGFKSKNM